MLVVRIRRLRWPRGQRDRIAGPRNNDLSSAAVKRGTRQHHDSPFFVCRVNIKSAKHTISADQPVQQPTLAVEIILLHLEMKDIEQFSVEVAIPHKCLYSVSRLRILHCGLHAISS